MSIHHPIKLIRDVCNLESKKRRKKGGREGGYSSSYIPAIFCREIEPFRSAP
jgi:hypothetical protein